MKILYISDGSSEDYQRDMLFHGLRSLFGNDVVDVNKINNMYKSASDSKNKLYGMGFTVYCLLDEINVDRTNIETKIKNNFYDYIVYGSIHRNRSYLLTVLNSYPKNRIAAIDGEDRWGGPFNGIFPIDVPYFKRENDGTNKNIFSIQFGIPEEKIFTGNVEKTMDISTATPISPNQKYQFKNEDEYYNSYRIAKFGITRRKAGWDCLRHYEIIANKCVPLFEEIEKCELETLTWFPKELCIEANKMYSTGNYSSYEELQFKFNSTIIDLTTKAMARRFIDKIISIQ
jgi:hypothetical protein